jgi:hypothetical protein
LFCSFYEQQQGLGGEGYLFASGGRYHQKFWKVCGKSINAYYPEYDKKVKIGTLLCGCAVGNRFVSGSTRGHLYVWSGRRLDRMIRAHELGVSAIWAGPSGVVTAAKDGIIKVRIVSKLTIAFFYLFVLYAIDSGLDVAVRACAQRDAQRGGRAPSAWRRYDLFSSTNDAYFIILHEFPFEPCLCSVRSLDAFMSPDNAFISRILVTTAGSEVYEIAAKSGNITLLHEAHFEGRNPLRLRATVLELLYLFCIIFSPCRRVVGPGDAPDGSRRVRDVRRRQDHPHLVHPGPAAAAEGDHR